MNFDGTYPERPYISEKQRMLDNTNTQEARPPVRVIVSYPQSEEWDGKPVQQWRKYALWIVVMILTSTAAFSAFYVTVRYLKTSINSSEIEVLIKAPVDRKTLVNDYILKYYEEKTRGHNIHTQLEFFKNEFNKLLETDDFLTDFYVPYKCLNSNETNDIKQDLMEHLTSRKFCLTQLADAENSLSSYEFQKKPTLTQNVKFVNCSEEDETQLKKLRNEYQKSVSVTRIDSSLIVEGKVLILKKIKKHLDSNPTTRQLIIIASVLYLDTDITQNIDIAIFAKTWKFVTTPIEFNLSGPHATDYHPNVSDGLPGKSGFDSGSFLAVGLGHVDNETLTLRMDGGNATAGHDGPDGENGTAVITDTKTELVLQGEKHCVVPLEKNFTNPAGEFLQKHAVFDERACPEAGGLGGPAGFPGTGGIAFFIGFDESRHFKGSDGASAENGVDGKNGSSTLGECYLIAYKYLQYRGEPLTWQTITTPSCHPENPYKLPLIPNRRANHRQQPEIKKRKTMKVFKSALKTFSDIARKKLNENNRELFSLLQLIESHQLGNATELEEEFNELEKNYNQIEIFESFAHKVENSRILNRDNQDLFDLKAMILSKIATLNTRFGVHYVVDIESYLQETLTALRKWDTKNSNYSYLLQSEQTAVIKKLSATKEVLLNLNPTVGANETDDAVTITTKILPQFVDILIVLLGKYAETPFTTLKETLDVFKERLEKSCHQDGPLRPEQLLNLQKCTDNSPIARKLLKGFYAIRSYNPLHGIAQSLNAIENELQPSLATTAIGKKLIMNVRIAVGDLSSLLFRIKQSLTETKLAKVMANVNGRRIFQNRDRERRVLKNLFFEQYLKALDAYKQWAFPYCDFKNTLTADDSKESLMLAIETIIDTLKTDRSTIKARDNQVIEAQFRLSSPVAPFFSWTRQDNENEIAQLLTGRRVQFRANLADSVHGLSKQAIKFRTAEIFLEGVPTSITKNFEMHLTHSGFSHFLYNGTTTTIVGPEIKILHSLDFDIHGEPSVKNNVYKKIKAGDVFLSPFTTWFLQLTPSNRHANFDDFQKYPTANVHLVGIGRYTSP